MISQTDSLFRQGQWSEWLPATPSQRSLLSIDLTSRGEGRPTVNVGLLVEGEWDRQRMEGAIALVMDRYGGLRQRFARVDGQILVNAFPTTPVIEGYAADGETDDERVRNAGAYCAAKFDLDAGQGVRWCIEQRAPDVHFVIMIAHHAILDGTSKMVVMRAVAEAYANGLDSPPSTTADPFETILRQIAAARQGDAGKQADQFWQDYLTPLPGNLGREVTIRDGDGPEFNRVLLDIPLDSAAVRRIYQHAEPWTRRPFVVFASLFAQCFAADESGLVSVTIGGRDRPGRRHAAGCLMQTIPMRLAWQGDDTFAQIDADLKAALQHSTLTAADLVERGMLPSGGMFSAPIDVQFQVRRVIETFVLDRPGLRLNMSAPVAGVRNLQPLAVNFRHQENFSVNFEFDPGLASREGVDAMIDRVHETLALW